jgi:hypothetical protein
VTPSVQKFLRHKCSNTAALLCALLALPLAVDAEEELDTDRQFDDWSVFIDSGDCWLATYPKDNYKNDVEDIMMYVAFLQRSMDPEISVLFEDSSLKVKDVEVLLAGKAYSLDVYEDTAYTAEAENITIVKKMLEDEPTSLSFANSAGVFTEFTIEYEGLRDAYNFTSKNCDFFRNSDLDGDTEKEPV